MTTIIDVAKKAGVSKSTVSRVVSKNGYVSDATRQKIEQAMDDLGYIPNMLARNLQSGLTKTIAFISHDFNQYTSIFLNAFTKTALKHDFYVNLYVTGGDKEKELDALNLMKYKQVDAVFIFTRSNSWDDIKPYRKYGPISTWHRIDSPDIYSSYVNQYDSYLMSLEFLANRGYRTIGHILGFDNNKNTLARINALDYFYEQHPELEKKEEWIFLNSKHRQTGRNIARKWHKAPNKPDCLVFYTDFIAAECISELQLLGYSIPENVGIMGFDNNAISEIIHLTTVDCHLETQAFNCFNYLYSELKKTEFTPIEITQDLVIRSSTK
ncbi:LacI family DNA-binding transcriptional regulator [Vagococcus bubulae]|uniref:LacI family transcriptional regulator n=1 Tax=Vagococcus bubulae TaxID=1977868 RepID=A0A429ZMA7_9ENTE|nr:LacI family DNA-binding transcriptional regulator [Vagococcus bubulae]RST94837.1 LacI family transcriptional regulator [Vagococcus bubulae]